MKEEIKFPLYRKLRNGVSVYRVDGPDQLVEYQRLGSKILRHELHATILPERVFIADIIANEGERWDPIGKEEFLAWEANHSAM